MSKKKQVESHGDEFINDIWNVIGDASEVMTLNEILGCFEIIKLDLYRIVREGIKANNDTNQQ